MVPEDANRTIISEHGPMLTSLWGSRISNASRVVWQVTVFMEWKVWEMKHYAILPALVTCGLSACLLTLATGCQPKVSSPPPSQPGATQSGTEEHAHDHAHGHDETGPHGGHVVEIGEERLHAEWTHNDASGEVVVYLLDSSAKADVTIPAATILITTKIGETEKPYELTAVSPEGGQSSRFALTDPSLVEALKAVGPGVEATIVVNLNDESLVGKFERHEHGGHQH